VAIHPSVVEDLAVDPRDLYAQPEEWLSGVIVRQLAVDFDAPGGPSATSRHRNAFWALPATASAINSCGPPLWRLDKRH
jgi:hypothetical protein